MKRIIPGLFILLLLVSCLKEPEFHSFQVNIDVDFGKDFPQDKKSGAKVILLNQTKSYSVESTTNSDGLVNFQSVEPGLYSITITYNFSKDGLLYSYNGVKDVQIFNDFSNSISISGTRTSAFVIKEFYYSGSTTPAGKPYSADQFIEIFNNSAETQYADGLSVIEHESYGSSENYWTSLKDSIVAKMVWTVPGNGNEIPILPGKSIVLARTGINHRSDPNGNPLSPVNLGNADFEFYVAKQPETDIDSPTVPNLEENKFVFRGNDVVFHVKGGSAIAIARIPGKNYTERMAYINKSMIAKTSASGSSSTYYVKIANSFVYDAVEVIMDEAHAVYKRLPSGMDIGYTYVVAGSGSGKCIRRKVKEIINGRVVYQDSNNSTEDFLKDVDPKPKQYE